MQARDWYEIEGGCRTLVAHDPRNIGKCWVCGTHLISEEVLEHMKKRHHSEYIKILKRNELL